MADEKVIAALAEMMSQAARASVAKGAQFAPGENISTDADGAWRGVAEVVVKLVEATVRERLAAPAEKT